MTRELVGVAEIAQLAHVTKTAVTHWQHRYADFPKPVAQLRMGPVFDRAEVETWLDGWEQETKRKEMK